MAEIRPGIAQQYSVTYLIPFTPRYIAELFFFCTNIISKQNCFFEF